MIREAVPVTVRGQHFHSMTACAKHFGVNVGHVTYMLDRGTLDNIGKGRNFDRKKAAFLDGQRFDSISDLARHIGMPPQHLLLARYRAIASGRDHIIRPQGRITWEVQA